MQELRVIFSDAHAGSAHNLRRMLEDDWPVIVVERSDTQRVELPHHSCPDCLPEHREYWDGTASYEGRHRVQSP